MEHINPWSTESVSNPSEQTGLEINVDETKNLYVHISS